MAEKVQAEERAKILQGLVGCKCITKELAEIVLELITREQARMKNILEEPYGRTGEEEGKRLKKLDAAEDALKGLDLCD